MYQEQGAGGASRGLGVRIVHRRFAAVLAYQSVVVVVDEVGALADTLGALYLLGLGRGMYLYSYRSREDRRSLQRRVVVGLSYLREQKRQKVSQRWRQDEKNPVPSLLVPESSWFD